MTKVQSRKPRLFLIIVFVLWILNYAEIISSMGKVGLVLWGVGSISLLFACYIFRVNESISIEENELKIDLKNIYIDIPLEKIHKIGISNRDNTIKIKVYGREIVCKPSWFPRKELASMIEKIKI